MVFAPHSLINDAPFSKMNLISCRNFLIYIEPQSQKKLIAMFHFALLPGGFLVLGSSETAGNQTNLFEPLSKKWRVYQKVETARREPAACR